MVDAIDNSTNRAGRTMTDRFKIWIAGMLLAVIPCQSFSEELESAPGLISEAWQYSIYIIKGDGQDGQLIGASQHESESFYWIQEK